MNLVSCRLRICYLDSASTALRAELGKDFKLAAFLHPFSQGLKKKGSLIPSAAKPKHIKEGLPNIGLKLKKQRPKHVIQGLPIKASATLIRGLQEVFVSARGGCKCGCGLTESTYHHT